MQEKLVIPLWNKLPHEKESMTSQVAGLQHKDFYTCMNGAVMWSA
ncbi:hypothetical protein SOVF_098860 [Spinacia oleracea]|nr:hypothetical protein SOVF_098860 [Spinacia oleracea]